MNRDTNTYYEGNQPFQGYTIPGTYPNQQGQSSPSRSRNRRKQND